MPANGLNAVDGNVIIKIEVGPDLSLQMVNHLNTQEQVQPPQQQALTPQNPQDAVNAKEPNAKGEYLEKMSVRGLDIQRYEHIIDGVKYCLVCAKNNIYKTFKNKYSFQRHAYLLHEGENRKIFPCPICNREFSRPDKMKLHKKDKHGDVLSTENNADTPPPPAKRPRTSAARNRKPPTCANNTSTPIDDAEATRKRLAQIDSIFDYVLKAESNDSIETTDLQTDEQPDATHTINQQPIFNSVVLAGGAQLQLASLNTSPATATTTMNALQPALNNIKHESTKNPTETSQQQPEQQQHYVNLGNVTYLPQHFINTMQNYQVLTSNGSEQNANNIELEPYNMSMTPYTFNQVHTENGTHLVLTTTSANHIPQKTTQALVNSFPDNNTLIKIEPSSNE